MRPIYVQPLSAEWKEAAQHYAKRLNLPLSSEQAELALQEPFSPSVQK